MTDKAIIVSDSYLLSELLRSAFRQYFAEVEIVPSLAALAETADWRDAVILIEVNEGEAYREELRTLQEARQLDRVMLLLRTEEQGRRYSTFMGTVGALIPPNTAADDIARIASVVRTGVCVWPRELLSAHHKPARGLQRSRYQTLTDRERTVLRYLSEGECNKMIASELHISDSTVRVHVRSLLQKLGAKNRTQAALYGSAAFD